MIQLSKVLKLLFGLMSKPIAARIKLQARNPHGLTRNLLIRCGRFWHKATFTSPGKHHDNYFIEKGSIFVSELIIWSIALAVPIYEMYRYSKINAQKERAAEQKLRRVERDMTDIEEKLKSLEEEKDATKVVSSQLLDGITLLK